MRGLQYSAGLLAGLTGLSGLQELHVDPSGGPSKGLEEVCKLTQLKHLYLWNYSEEGLLLQLTQLRQLTKLEYANSLHVGYMYNEWIQEVSSSGVRFGLPRCMLY